MAGTLFMISYFILTEYLEMRRDDPFKKENSKGK